MKNRNLLLYIVSAMLSVLFLGYVLLNLDWEILHSAFADIHWVWLGFALTAYLVNIALRALRFSNLIYSRQTTWLELVPVSALHNILMYLMPAKTGDMTYIFIVKNRINVSLTEGTSTLLAARFYDFTVVALILAILLPFSKNEIPGWIFRSALLFCVLVLLGALAILIFLRSKKPKAEIENSAPSDSKGLFIRINIAWKKFVFGLREIQAHGAHGKLTLLTAGIWVCVYSNFYFAAQSIGLSVMFYHIAIISIVMIPLTLLPLQGFANLGTHEVGWVSVLVAFHYPYETALAIAAGTHFILLISVLIAGATAFFGAQWIININKRT